MTRPIATCIRWLAAALVALATIAPATAQEIGATPDGRLYGHISYAEAVPTDLVSAPPGFAVGQPCQIQPALVGDLTAMLAAEKAAGVPGELKGISCYRSIAHQTRVFCDRPGARRTCRNAADRAESVAPPGHSEHATGYAIDFGTRPAHGCGDVDDCFANTPAGRWLIANAPDYGFELSFPNGNAQGVTWEPWHWRWVGTSNSEPGALAARALFASARENFPASPRIPTIVVRVLSQPPLPTPGIDEVPPTTVQPPLPLPTAPSP